MSDTDHPVDEGFRREQALLADTQAAKQHLDAVLQRISDGFIVLDRDWRYVALNDWACESMAMSRDQILGRCIWELYPDTVGTRFEDELRRAVGEQKSTVFEYFYPTRNRWYENRVYPSTNGISIFFAEITERKRAEAALRESEERVTRILESITDGMVTFDQEWRFTYVNGRAEEALGRTGAKLLGKCVWVEFPANVGTDVERQLRRAAAEQVTCEYEGHDPVQDRWYDNRVFPMPHGIAVYFRDVTERKQAEDKLRQSEALLAESQELAHVGSWNWDLNTDVLTWSDEHYHIFGLERQEGPMTFERGIRVIHPDDLPRVLRTVDEARRDRTPYECSLRVLRPDGSIRFVHSRGRTVYDQTGKSVRMYGTVQDVTERVRAEEAVRVANEQLDLALRGSNIGVWDLDLAPGSDYRRDPVRFVNVWEQLGYDPAEFPADATASRALGHPDDLPRVDAAVAACLAGESEEIRVENRIRHKDGSYRWLLTLGRAVRDASGSPVRLIGTVQDVTERKRAEEALRASEERLAAFLEQSPVGLGLCDREGRWIVSNANMGRYYGSSIPSRDPTNARRWRGWGSDGNLLDTSQWPAARALRGEHLTLGLDFLHTFEDGHEIWTRVSCVPFRNKGGELLGAITIVQDIDQQKRAEEALRKSEERLAADLAAMKRLLTVSNRLVRDGDAPPPLLEIVDAAIAITGADRGNIQLLDRASGTLRIEASRGFEAPFLEFFNAVHDGEAACGGAMQRGERVVIEDVAASPAFAGTPALDVVLAAGVRAVQSTPLLARSGRFVGMLSTHYREPQRPADRDLHILDLLARQAADWIERTQAEEELKHTKEVAEAANRAKDEFLANVSHEIRTPFGAILGMTELVLDTPLTDDQRQCLETARSAAEGLLGLVDALLDFEKIEAGKLELDAADFSLGPVVGDALRALAARAHQKGLELAFDVHPGVPDALIGDAGRLRQILLNLVGNAVKFTERGEVLVSISAQEAGDSSPSDSCLLRFEVTDTGIGIPPEGRDRIFRAFEQADASTTRRHGGSGLGLTIAARLVALMGGTIALESEVGRGSTFVFTARFDRPPHPPVSTADRLPAVLYNLPVLVVDDNATARQILDGWLRGWGMAPTCVGDAAAALDALIHGTAGGHPFALVLLDARMPGTDALELASVIRERTELSGTRIVLLTSGDRPEDPTRLAGLSLDARLLKPVPPAELLDAIDRVMSRPSGILPPTLIPAVPAPPMIPLQILVAEDDEFNARHLDRLLGKAGHRVRLATNGREALTLLGIGGPEAGVRAGSDFDLLLLDLHMPEFDGFQVTRAIREREQAEGGHLPVIALTARSRREDRERCLQTGMDEFLSKPVKAAELFAAIRRTVPTGPDGRSAGANAASRSGLLDPAALLAACGDDPGGLRGLCEDFQTYAPARLAEVGAALQNGDAPRVREAAHKLGGLLSAFSTTAGSVASEAEDRAAVDRLDEVGPLVGRLEVMIRELMAQVDGLTLEALRGRAAVG